MSAKQYLIDASTRHQVFLQRYAGSEAKKAINTLNRLRRDINARLSQEPTIFQTQRLTAVLNDLDKLKAAAYQTISNDVQKGVQGLVMDEADFSSTLYGKTTNVDFGRPAEAQLMASIENAPMVAEGMRGMTIQEALKKYGGAKSTQINRLITDGVTLGKTTPEIAREVGTMMNTLHRRQLETLVRTSTNHASSVARKEVYNHNDHLLEGYEWVATLDSRTTVVCGSRDGKIYQLSDNIYPPAHWGCRSTTIPAVKDEFTLAKGMKGKRPSKGATGTKVISGKTNYGRWLKRQPKEFVDEALGVERSRLFRAGKLTLNKFVDPTGRLYTLDELRRMNEFAFIDSTVGTTAVIEAPKPKPKPKPKTKPVSESPKYGEIPILSKAQATKELKAFVTKAAKDSRYVLDDDGLPYTRFRPNRIKRGMSSTDAHRALMGKANITTLSAEGASIVNQVVKESNEVLKRYGIQPIRGVNTGVGKGANASMGDGILSVSKNTFNRLGTMLDPEAAVKAKAARKKVDKLKKELEKDLADLKARQQVQGYFRDPDYRKAAVAYNKKVDAYNRQQKDLSKMAARPKPDEKTLNWKVGDSLDDRAFTAGSYYKDEALQMRSTIFHEMGHQVHQQFNVQSIAGYNSPPLENTLDRIFRSNLRTVTPTKYAGSNSHEWFAENFSLYHLGRKDLVDPILADLLESIAAGTYDDFLTRYSL